jgi:hypothetical protein
MFLGLPLAPDAADATLLVKTILTGESSTGKTNLLSPVGAPALRVRFQLWDTVGQERCRAHGAHTEIVAAKARPAGAEERECCAPVRSVPPAAAAKPRAPGGRGRGGAPPGLALRGHSCPCDARSFWRLQTLRREASACARGSRVGGGPAAREAAQAESSGVRAAPARLRVSEAARRRGGTQGRDKAVVFRVSLGVRSVPCVASMAAETGICARPMNRTQSTAAARGLPRA